MGKKKGLFSKSVEGFISVDGLLEVEDALLQLTEALPKGALRAAQLHFRIDEANVEFIQLADHWWVKLHSNAWYEEEVNYG